MRENRRDTSSGKAQRRWIEERNQGREVIEHFSPVVGITVKWGKGCVRGGSSSWGDRGVLLCSAADDV